MNKSEFSFWQYESHSEHFNLLNLFSFEQETTTRKGNERSGKTASASPTQSCRQKFTHLSNNTAHDMEQTDSIGNYSIFNCNRHMCLLLQSAVHIGDEWCQLKLNQLYGSVIQSIQPYSHSFAEHCVLDSFKHISYQNEIHTIISQELNVFM